MCAGRPLDREGRERERQRREREKEVREEERERERERERDYFSILFTQGDKILVCVRTYVCVYV